jgi:putative peptidoglycan lipid II flippase
VILRQFGLSVGLDLDAFNAANNLPDMLFALISGGSLAMALIPVLTDVMSKEGRRAAWNLFSRIANLAFLATFAFTIVFALFAQPLVRYLIVPSFSPERQALVVELMRLNLIGTIIFSISGLVIAGLQANQHFLLPALAPLLYNIGQIIGVSVFAPKVGMSVAGFTLPTLGLGEQGMVYGVILGALMHLGIQMPGLFKYKFHWIPSISWRDADVQKVLKVLLPRVGVIALIQCTYIIRDNLASSLSLGSISALTYGWMIQQVPETIIGTAIGTALLPTLAEFVSRENREQYRATIQKAFRVLLALTIPAGVIFGMGVAPMLVIFKLSSVDTNVLLWVTRGFLFGLTGHCLIEVAARAFYAQQDAKTPLWTAAITTGLYALIGVAFLKSLGAFGISLADSISFTLQALLLIAILSVRFQGFSKYFREKWQKFMVGLKDGKEARSTFLRALASGIASFFVIWVFLWLLTDRVNGIVLGSLAMLVGLMAALPFIWKELRQLVNL